MKKFNSNEILDQLSINLKDWSYGEGIITRDFEFADFTEAFSFMTAVALKAEHSDHHPEWSNVYNKVSINLRTHSAGGITQLDFDLAAKIDSVYSLFTKNAGMS
jgi:4a-hydroxytetrahydrobiopterin dehydratase